MCFKILLCKQNAKQIFGLFCYFGWLFTFVTKRWNFRFSNIYTMIEIFGISISTNRDTISFSCVVVVVAKILWQYERLYLNWKSGSKEIGNCQNIGDCLNERPLFWLHLFFIYFCFFFHFSVNTSTYLLWLNVFFPSNLCCFKLLLCNTPVICNQRISLWFNNFSQNCLQNQIGWNKSLPIYYFPIE